MWQTLSEAVRTNTHDDHFDSKEKDDETNKKRPFNNSVQTVQTLIVPTMRLVNFSVVVCYCCCHSISIPNMFGCRLFFFFFCRNCFLACLFVLCEWRHTVRTSFALTIDGENTRFFVCYASFNVLPAAILFPALSLFLCCWCLLLENMVCENRGEA